MTKSFNVKLYKSFCNYLKNNNYCVIVRIFRSYFNKFNTVHYFVDDLNHNPNIYENCHAIPNAIFNVNCMDSRIEEYLKLFFEQNFIKITPLMAAKMKHFKEEMIENFLNSNHIIKKYSVNPGYLFVSFSFIKRK